MKFSEVFKFCAHFLLSEGPEKVSKVANMRKRISSTLAEKVLRCAVKETVTRKFYIQIYIPRHLP